MVIKILINTMGTQKIMKLKISSDLGLNIFLTKYLNEIIPKKIKIEMIKTCSIQLTKFPYLILKWPLFVFA